MRQRYCIAPSPTGIRVGLSEGSSCGFDGASVRAMVGSGLSTGIGVQFAHGTNFDAADARRRNLRCELHRFVQILGIDQIEARELLLGLGERAIGHRYLAVAHAHRGCGVDALQRLGGDASSALFEPLAECQAFAVGDHVELLLIEIDETQIFHGLLLVSSVLKGAASSVTPRPYRMPVQRPRMCSAASAGTFSCARTSRQPAGRGTMSTATHVTSGARTSIDRVNTMRRGGMISR